MIYYFSYWCHLGEERRVCVVGFRKNDLKSS